MILNEDYFKDLELTDDDINGISDDIDTQDIQLPDNIHDLLSDMEARNYKFIIEAYFCDNLKVDERYIIRQSKLLYKLFDLYNIPHSYVYVLCGQFYNIQMYDEAIFTQHDDYIEVKGKGRGQRLYKHRSFCIFISDINTNSIKFILRFIQRVAHSIYKNNTNVVNREIEDFIIGILPLERHQISKFYSNPAHDGEKAYDYKLDSQELDINQQIIAGRVIKWFFGDQTMKRFAKLIKRGKTAEALNANIVPDDNPYKSDKLDVTEWRKI